MKLIYVLFDVVAQAVVSSLFVYPNDAAAIRAFGDALQDPQSSFSRHPRDFELRCCGIMQDSGAVSGVDAQIPRTVMTGEQWMAAQPKPGASGEQLQLLKEA